jgi:hypothetical protein
MISNCPVHPFSVEDKGMAKPFLRRVQSDMKKHLNLLLFINTNFMDVDGRVLLYNNDFDI